MPFLAVYGHTNIDNILEVGHLPGPDTSMNVRGHETLFGGTAANVCIRAACLGVPSALCSFVGGDMPSKFRSLLEEKGVDLRDLVVRKDKGTPTVWIVSADDQHQVAYVYQGAMGDIDDLDLRLTAAREATWAHMMTGRPKYQIRVMRELRRLGKKVALDPAQEIHHIWSADEFAEALRLADILFCNESELESALRHMGKKHPQDLLDSVGMVVNTLGKEGSRILTKDGEVRIPVVKAARVVDPTGAGDAFRSGFFAGLYRGLDYEDAALCGSASASFALEEKGAMSCLPSWEQTQGRIRSVHGQA
jgi:sugar/nucleoside kinase (ribokinase family)